MYLRIEILRLLISTYIDSKIHQTDLNLYPIGGLSSRTSPPNTRVGRRGDLDHLDTAFAVRPAGLFTTNLNFDDSKTHLNSRILILDYLDLLCVLIHRWYCTTNQQTYDIIAHHRWTTSPVVTSVPCSTIRAWGALEEIIREHHCSTV